MASDEIQYLFGLKIKDKEIQLGGDRIFVETQMEKWLKIFAGELPADLMPSGHTPAAPSARAADMNSGAANARKLPTLAEFLKTKEPKEISDAILVVGLYMERFQQKNLFTRWDLMQTLFNRMGKSEEDVQQALTFLVNQQFLSETQTMGSSDLSYSLTFSGEQVVKEGFQR
ncbi:hypothetical protein COW36_20960 [bacterium (Candidatus Blackallbacteria) CG17_big_fil_post_rev_8_21_14_2_50_48_46]|uniref:Uncharacterized protein n=1 Tax=bacterium (Candidatus Blackallbacteria) CG17_big_fil_post_rev_8_21_14_2_50_48_46 TaxID=2014261 RepID=A0A2M7FYR7_9BACT|nr:MAG: hypothetical protein COW64_14270 [bacterium (Candidatus Blackallbacteria) CG18_big_fil_WC_8_21_14_2_50_49_26]PIW14513.1 MAG: hypothetical protein COW36_20960 [bacterium (Candidatus Blackallbacteria) CG17_big_fil_post_rev_8_21_14_2_50_48_46]PIW47198.1 MAG: hypothetical protein COW20_13405 [bacterium (Candidatus Blackallbacteria) CG13_big_fil_rev_8_21_14_2_50_49_14]